MEDNQLLTNLMASIINWLIHGTFCGEIRKRCGGIFKTALDQGVHLDETLQTKGPDAPYSDGIGVTLPHCIPAACFLGRGDAGKSLPDLAGGRYIVSVFCDGVCRSITVWLYRLGIRPFFPHARFVIRLAAFFVFVGMLLPWFLGEVLVFAFHLLGLNIYHSGYLDHEYHLMYRLVAGYTVAIVFMLSYRNLERTKRREKILMARNKEKEQCVFDLQFEEDLSKTFMIIRRGDAGFILRNNGTFRKDGRRTAEIREILAVGYRETSRGVYINKKDIVFLDIENAKVILTPEKGKVLEEMMCKYEELHELNEAVKSEHGLLALSAALCRKQR